MTIDEALKKEVFDYLHRRVPDFKPDTWGLIVLEGEQGDYTEIVVAGYTDSTRHSYCVLCYEHDTHDKVRGFSEIIKKPY